MPSIDDLFALLSPADRAAVERRARQIEANPEIASKVLSAIDAVESKTPIVTATPERRRAEKARSSFRFFVEIMWPVVEPAFAFLPGKHVDAICEHLQAAGEGKIKRLLINVPPGHAKSLLTVVLWPAWMWLRNPGWRVLTGSYAMDLAIRDAQRTRELITSSEYEDIKRQLGLTWKLSADQNLKSYFQNDAKGFRIALSVGSKATGFRGDCLIFDDLVNVKEAHKITRESLEEARSWWKVTMSSRLNDLKQGVKIGIMQRVSEYDPCEDLIKSRKADGSFEYDLVALPTEYDPDLYKALGRNDATTSLGWKDWRTTQGELLFPELFPADVIDGVKSDLGALAYAAQHGQRPAPASGGFFARQWWRFWYPEGTEAPAPVVTDTPSGMQQCVQVRLPRLVGHTISADLTFKETVGADNVALQAWAYGDEDGHKQSRFLLGEVCEKMDFVKTLNKFQGFCDAWPLAGLKLIEDAANGPAVISSLKTVVTGIVPVKPLGGKEARANAVSPLIESGHVYLPHPSLPGMGWVSQFLLEVSAFPKGAHDDRVDAMTQFLARKRVIVV